MSLTVSSVRVVVATPYLNSKGNTVAAVSDPVPIPAGPGAATVFASLRGIIACPELAVVSIRDGVDVWHAASPKPGWVHNAVATAGAKMLAGKHIEISGPAVFIGSPTDGRHPTSLTIADAQEVWEILSAAAASQWNA